MILIFQLLGVCLFFLPGILLSYIILPKTDIIKRTAFSILLSPLIAVILGSLLYLLSLLNSINTISVLIFLSISFLLIILNSDKEHKTNFNNKKEFFYIALFSIIGFLWRFAFLKSIKNFGDSYTYAGKFIGKTVPNLGIYTGMAIDHSRFIGVHIFSKISEFLLISRLINILGTFLTVFLFLSFVYLIISEYRNKKLALVGVALMSLGPIEIFHTTFGFFGHAFSYLSLFSLFLLYKSENENSKSYFLLALLLSITMALSYFTSAMVNMLASVGFITAVSIKEKTIKNKKILFFALIAAISLLFIFNTSQTNLSNVELLAKHITTSPITKYQDPTFLGLSAIRWQMLFFFLCSLTFPLYLIRKKRFPKDNENPDLLLCLIPLLIVSFCFFYTNLPARIFNYFAFFTILLLKIPKKYLKIFLILSFIFLLISGFYTAKAKKIFYTTSDKEIQGAKELTSSLQGKIFSDQHFINQLILNGYYNVTGIYDNDPLMHSLFYQNNLPLFLDTVNILNKQGIDYIAITKRMQEQYILMLNMPQKPLINSKLYEENLEKIYDNEEVKVYKIKN